MPLPSDKRRQDVRHYGKHRQDVHHYSGKHRQDARHYKKVKMYPVLPYLPRKDRIAFDTKGSAISIPVFAMESIHSRLKYSTGSESNTDSDFMKSVGGLVAFKSFVSNKEWKRLVAQGLNATNPYSRVGVFAKQVQYHGSADANYGAYTAHVDCWGQVIGPVLVNQHDPTPLINLATARLKHKLDGFVGKAELAAPLAEAREIHRIIRQINTLGLDAVKALLLLKKTKGKSLYKFASQIWLGYGFGIRPMLKDIESAANAILDYQTRNDRGVRVKGTANEDYFSSGSASPTTGLSNGVDSEIFGSAFHKQGVHIVAGVDINIRSNASYSVMDHLGLGFSSMPSAIWELVPFSWVVDYFTTVSQWLDDTFYTLPGTTKYISQSIRYQNEVVWELRPVSIPPFKGNITWQPGGLRYFSFTRTSLASLPTRGLRVKSADVIAMHSLTKLLNLAAVLSNSVASPRV